MKPGARPRDFQATLSFTRAQSDKWMVAATTLSNAWTDRSYQVETLKEMVRCILSRPTTATIL